MDSREQLAEEMNERRKQLGLRWSAVATLAGMTQQNLLRIRQGSISVTEDAAYGIERALQWQHGYVDATLARETGGAAPNTAEAQHAVLREAVKSYIARYGDEALERIREDAGLVTESERRRAAGSDSA